MWLNTSSGPHLSCSTHAAVRIQKSNIEFGEPYLLATITAHRRVSYKHSWCYTVKLLGNTDNMTLILLPVAIKFGAESKGVDEGEYSPFYLTNYLC